jgi:prepilin-type N-terminal cleavage/methylation domain-containing protein
MGNKGFTLLELVMVIVVIGVSSLGLVAVMRQVVINIHKPQVISTATALAEEEMERILLISFAATAAISSTNFTGSFSAYSYSAAVTSIDVNDKEVVVTVHHPAIGSMSLAFLRTNY